MKPLPAAPLTDEDWDIWAGLAERASSMSALKWAYFLGVRSAELDRRDAALMLAWSQGWPIDVGWCDESDRHMAWLIGWDDVPAWPESSENCPPQAT
jgi:hypothetical protein